MNQEGFKYDGIQNALTERFPEIWPRIERAFGSYYDLDHELPEAYPTLEDVFKSMIWEQLDQLGADISLLNRIFKFLEEMAESQDPEVPNLLWIAILERLAFNKNRLARAWTHMGEATKQLALEIIKARS